jgi:IclR family transcriptional regulator, acetate operon repressor
MSAASRPEPPSTARRIASILDAFRGDRDALGISELARRTALPKASVHRLVGQLVAAGMLERDGVGVQLGLKMFEIGQLVPVQRTLQEAARPIMSDLREVTRHTVNLAVRSGADVLYVEIVRGPQAPQTPTRVGGRWPLHATAVGKAILAVSEPAEVEEFLALPLRRVGNRTITAPGLLAQELERVRETGSAFDHEESKPGLVCAASPVFGRKGVVAGLSVSGWSATMDLDRTAVAVRTAAAGVSRLLGGSKFGAAAPVSGGR